MQNHVQKFLQGEWLKEEICQTWAGITKRAKKFMRSIFNHNWQLARFGNLVLQTVWQGKAAYQGLLPLIFLKSVYASQRQIHGNKRSKIAHLARIFSRLGAENTQASHCQQS